MNAASLINDVRRGFSDKEAAREASERISAAIRTPVLFLDDLGKGHPGRDVSWMEEQLYSLIDARYREELPTVVTTEWKAAALVRRVGDERCLSPAARGDGGRDKGAGETLPRGARMKDRDWPTGPELEAELDRVIGPPRGRRAL